MKGRGGRRRGQLPRIQSRQAKFVSLSSPNDGNSIKVGNQIGSDGEVEEQGGLSIDKVGSVATSTCQQRTIQLPTLQFRENHCCCEPEPTLPSALALP